MKLQVGSGDIHRLMAGKDTASFINLMKEFISEPEKRNALASPIDACRTGAILEQRYSLILPDNYYPQYKCVSTEMDVFSCTLDFSKIENGKVVDFDELKTLGFTDFIDQIEPLRFEAPEVYIPYIKKHFKNYYNQVQEQLYCTGLASGNLVFLIVHTHDDEKNYSWDVQQNDFIKFRIKRDEKTISEIKKRGEIFQQIKNYFNE